MDQISGQRWLGNRPLVVETPRGRTPNPFRTNQVGGRPPTSLGFRPKSITQTTRGSPERCSRPSSAVSRPTFPEARTLFGSRRAVAHSPGPLIPSSGTWRGTFSFLPALCRRVRTNWWVGGLNIWDLIPHMYRFQLAFQASEFLPPTHLATRLEMYLLTA